MNLLFGYIQRFASKTNSILLVGMLSLMTIIWFAGPYIGLTSRLSRLYVILALVAIIVLVFAVKKVIYHIKGKRLANDLCQTDESSKEMEIQILKGKMQDAINSIKTSSIGIKYKGKSALYALPWYMIIGPSAAGKTSMIRNSGLEFPVSQNREIDVRGLEGTRNCDWWFTSDAVLLDTSGRYTTDEDGTTEWLDFLSMLRSHRSRRPINGIIVTLSIPDIAANTDKGIADHVKIIRKRINELITELGFLFPIYIVFTKCDLVDGFAEYFADTGDESRNRVFGYQLTDGDDEEIVQYASAKTAELLSLIEKDRIRKISLARRVKDKRKIHKFPYDFSYVAKRINRFIDQLISDNPYQEKPYFSGVYFTSAVQKGLPLECIVDNIGKSLVYRNDETGEDEKPVSFFIQDLFKSIVFGNRQSPYKNRKRYRAHKWLKRIVVATSALFVAASVSLLSASYVNNRNLVANARPYIGVEGRSKVTDELIRRIKDLSRYLASIDRVNKDTPLTYRLGLYQGVVLDDQLQQYRNELVHILVTQKYKGYLYARLSKYHRKWKTIGKKDNNSIRQAYYDTLKQYLTLRHVDRLDVKEFTNRLARYLSGNGISSISTARSISKSYVQAYLVKNAITSIDKQMVIIARHDLSANPDAELLYSRLRHGGISRYGYTTLSDLSEGKDIEAYSSTYRIPVLYTRQGWEKYMKNELVRLSLKGVLTDWVLQGDNRRQDILTAGNISTANKINILVSGIRKRYASDYANHWIALINSLGIRQGYTTQQGIGRSMTRIAAVKSDFRKLLGVIHQQIAIESEERKKTKSGHRYLLSGLLPGLISFSDIKANARVIDKYIKYVSVVQGEYSYITGSPDKYKQASSLTKNVLSGKGRKIEAYNVYFRIANLLSTMDEGSRRPLQHLTSLPVKRVWRTYLALSRVELNRKWTNSVYREYKTKLSGKYPFRVSGEDVSLADLSDFMSPENGVLWKYFNTHLRPYLDRKHGRWVAKSWLGYSAGFSRRVLGALNRADKFTRSLFSRNKSRPAIVFYLNPVPTPGLQQVILTINGQEYEYRNYPGEWKKFEWPSRNPVAGARVVAVSTQNNYQSVLSKKGEWGLFHLLRAGKLTRIGNRTYKTYWNMKLADGSVARVVFKLKAFRKNNIFERIHKLRSIPSSLFRKPAVALNDR
jgi:type VI secretion system protein ImpL